MPEVTQPASENQGMNLGLSHPTRQGLVDFSGRVLPSLYVFKVGQEPEKTSYPGGIQLNPRWWYPTPSACLGEGGTTKPTDAHQSELSTINNGLPRSDLDLEKPLQLACQLVSTPREGYQLPGNARRS